MGNLAVSGNQTQFVMPGPGTGKIPPLAVAVRWSTGADLLARYEQLHPGAGGGLPPLDPLGVPSEYDQVTYGLSSSDVLMYCLDRSNPSDPRLHALLDHFSELLQADAAGISVPPGAADAFASEVLARLGSQGSGVARPWPPTEMSGTVKVTVQTSPEDPTDVRLTFKNERFTTTFAREAVYIYDEETGTSTTILPGLKSHPDDRVDWWAFFNGSDPDTSPQHPGEPLPNPAGK